MTYFRLCFRFRKKLIWLLSQCVIKTKTTFYSNYLKPRTPKELLYKWKLSKQDFNNFAQKLLTVNYFCKRAPSQMFDWVLNTSLKVVPQRCSKRVLSMMPWCSGYHHCKTLFNRVWTWSFCVDSCWRGVRDLKGNSNNGSSNALPITKIRSWTVKKIHHPRHNHH